MKRTIILIFTAVLALLTAACGAPEAEPAASPAPSGPNVQVHWDALETPQAGTVERWYEEYAPELIPSDEYGQLVPYIGGESQSEIWGTSWFYGLATHDGVIVTDPVFLEVTALDWYDPTKYGRVQGGALILHSAVEAADGPVDEYSPGFEDRYGLAAADGSWYTGQVYTDLICQSELGALFFDLDGCIVMVSAGGGAELWRWEAGEIPFEGLVPDMYYWDSVSTSGDYMIYTEWDGATGDSWLTYVDLRDGSVLDGEPEGLDHGSAYDPESDRTRFSGGWYSISGGVLSIELDSGETHSFPMPEGSGEYSYPDIDGDRAIISLDDGASVMTDLDGNELLRSDVLSMEDLRPGMELTGTVRNVIDFGAFVDIGVHQDGLVHISEITDRYIKHPSDVLKVGQQVKAVVISVDVKKQRIGLSLKQVKKITN